MELLILATEGGIPTSNPWSQLALPLGILIFVGSVYMLMRSNLGTRRGYLVMGASLWGFGFLLSLFWAFGAPGTPPNTGPQNLPGQELDEYQPVWVPFAQDAAVVTEEGSPYASAVNAYPDGWEDPPAELMPAGDEEDGPGTEGVEVGAQNIQSFFGSLADNEEFDFGQNVLFGTEAQVGDPLYTVADNGRPMIAVTFGNTCELAVPADAEEGAEPVLPDVCQDAGLENGDLLPADAVDENGNSLRNEQTFFAFFDAGAPYFPSLLMVGIMGVLFALHMGLLARDETRERRETEETEAEEVEVEERATVGV
ncbi:hypothetical protein [Euzebya tangerina]|uniref:hypothetical protein n=1 Tax=Euzebya tangerina TaxID=591198 RepID=UPI000E30E4DF|nr:hypothetical protein [Euzebya tangerina]